MAVKKTKTLAEVTTVTTINTDQYIPVTDAYGNVTKVSLESLKSAIFGGMGIDSINEGVYIACHNTIEGNRATLIELSKWNYYKERGEVADGVALVQGDKILVIAPTDAVLKMDETENVVSGIAIKSNTTEAVSDWDGKNNTEQLLNNPNFNSPDRAIGFCAQYSRTNPNGIGLTSGSWWLPSCGELMFIFANIYRINYALSLIQGATKIDSSNSHWSSSTAKNNMMWTIYPGLRKVNSVYKGNMFRVRPVSTIINHGE